MTPAQFQALSKRHDAERKANDYSTGIVASTIANCHRNPKKQSKPFEPKDFMPVYQAPKKKDAAALKDYWKQVVVPHFNSQANARAGAGGG